MARDSRISTSCVAFSFSIGLAATQGADDDILLLNIEGNLIGSLGSIERPLDSRRDAVEIVREYHLLLAETVEGDVERLHQQLIKLLPDFEVAYAAADSAEVIHVMGEINNRWTAIQEVHAQNYTQEVTSLLYEAYQLILPTFGDEQ